MGQQISCRLTRRFILLLLFSLVIIPIKLHVVLANDDLFESRQHREHNIKQGSMGMDRITRERLRDNIDRYSYPNMDDRTVKYDPMRKHRLLGKTQGDHKASMYDTSDNSSSTTWTIEAVDAPKGFSNFSSRAIAIDSSNNPHIAYGGDHLYYAHYNGSSWVYETVDSSPGVGEYASIALDTSGKAHISYSANGLKYATNASGAWVTTTVDSGSGGGMESTSIAIDTSGNAHISSFYYTGTTYSNPYYGVLQYATNASGAWVTTAVDSGGGMESTSIAIDASGNAHISYYDRTNYNLKYATNASGEWVTTTVDSDGYGPSTSIDMDTSGNAHISYSANGLKYATNASGAWVTTTVDSVGGSYASIALDASGNAHISYSANGLKYATNASGVWVTTTVDSDGGSYTSIAMDTAGNAHISYYD
ncbi:MAG: hypothetical protein HYW13_04560, partial [Planctomycetes bacterium]|nr:hypothetical protein [Planctomycetota bacterium]